VLEWSWVSMRLSRSHSCVLLLAFRASATQCGCRVNLRFTAKSLLLRGALRLFMGFGYSDCFFRKRAPKGPVPSNLF
jgi:hypothetical protein